MTISEKLAQVNEIKGQIRDAVNEKGGEIPSSAPFADFPAGILGIPQEVLEGGFTGLDFGSTEGGVKDAVIGSFISHVDWGSSTRYERWELRLRFHMVEQGTNKITENFTSTEEPLYVGAVSRNTSGTWFMTQITTIGSASVISASLPNSGTRSVSITLPSNGYGSISVRFALYAKHFTIENPNTES